MSGIGKLHQDIIKIQSIFTDAWQLRLKEVICVSLNIKCHRPWYKKKCWFQKKALFFAPSLDPSCPDKFNIMNVEIM